ncbi:acyl-CoA thioesterase [Proteiniphilum acetatigenes]|uniref:acyl-CoA thioesterase n=1 Tax=Proteiniphilum acetatigenes TaxID=294710 RepID=UPI00037A3527|nr:acyl-CoA thioesterase [Proteiniphilum acetatigenes]SFL17493.1 acyl-CoA thioester hydrolase [Porphyromonadaceae bacterium KH3CP3RA]
MDPVFAYKMKVRDYECDVQGHVNNANYQHYFEVTRHEFLEKAGLNFHQLHLQGIDAVVSRVEIRYKIPLVGMDEFNCTVHRIERTGVKYIFHQKIIRLADNTVCAKAKIEVVNLVNGKLSQPEVFDEVFAPYI